MINFLKVFILMCVSTFSIAATNNVPNKFIGTWADSIRTCKTKEPTGDYMFLVNISPKIIKGQYAESSFTYTPIQTESHGVRILNTAGKMAPYYNEDGGDQQAPTLENVIFFLRNGGLFILPLSEDMLVKCS